MKILIVRLDPLTQQVKRVADALELLLKEVYGLPREKAEAGEPEVSYATDEQTVAQEIEDALVKAGYKPPSEE